MASDKRLQTTGLEARVEFLEQNYVWILDSLHMAATFGEVQAGIQSGGDQGSVFQITRKLVGRLIDFEVMAFLVVKEADQSFILTDCEPEHYRTLLQPEIDAQIDAGAFAWALPQNRPVIVSPKVLRHKVLLHVLATRSRVIGMFIGMMKGDERRISDVALTLLSILMQNSASAYENQDLYEKVTDYNRNLEHTIQERTADLHLALEEKEAAHRAKSEFLANMSHEIRTPMNTILGFSQLLAEEISAPELLKYVQAILSSGRDLLTLINDILDLSKIEAGFMEIRPNPVRPGDVLEEIINIYRYQAEAKGLYLRASFEHQIPAMLLDETRLRQVLINLVGNAIKFTEKGGITMRLSATTPDTHGSAYNLVLEVADTGIGIPQPQIEKIFQAFVQSSGENNRQFGGTGLGLTITKRLVDMMGGAISVTSEEGKGATFRVELKDVPVAAVTQNGTAADDAGARAVAFEPNQVLLVEDVPLNRELIKGFLRSTPLDIVEATNGAAGLNLARKLKPAAIIMDMQMPIMDGYEATLRIREEESLGAVPIIALTASAFSEDEARARESGCDAFLRKPVEKEELIQTLARYIPTLDQESPGPAAETEPSDTAPLILPAEIDRDKLHWALDQLQTAHMSTWRELQTHMVMDDLAAFGRTLSGLGQQFQLETFRTWGEKVTRSATAFQIDELTNLLTHYPRLVDTLAAELAVQTVGDNDPGHTDDD